MTSQALGRRNAAPVQGTQARPGPQGALVVPPAGRRGKKAGCRATGRTRGEASLTTRIVGIGAPLVRVLPAVTPIIPRQTGAGRRARPASTAEARGPAR